MKWIKDLWDMWVDFTDFHATRKCYLDEMLWGNSIKKKTWWGYKHIPYLEFMRTYKENK